MKLIFCTSCEDVVKLTDKSWRVCECKKSGGQYNDDGLTATIQGPCEIIGIANPFFHPVFRHFTEDGMEWYRKRNGYEKRDIWYGENKGDKQVFRLHDGEKPGKLNMTPTQASVDLVLYLEDDRLFRCDDDICPSTVIISGHGKYYKAYSDHKKLLEASKKEDAKPKKQPKPKAVKKSKLISKEVSNETK